MNVFDKQDTFLSKMIEAYNNGAFENASIFKPYMDWKQNGNMNISRDQSWTMREEAQRQLEKFYDLYPRAYDDVDSIVNDDPWQMYQGYGGDKFMVSFLEGIDSELTNIHVLLS